MAAQAVAVNVLYFDAVLLGAAPFRAEGDGGFVDTAEPMPVGSMVTVELLDPDAPDRDPTERLMAKVDSVREDVTGGPPPGMRLRFAGPATDDPIPLRMRTKAEPSRPEPEAPRAATSPEGTAEQEEGVAPGEGAADYEGAAEYQGAAEPEGSDEAEGAAEPDYNGESEDAPGPETPSDSNAEGTNAEGTEGEGTEGEGTEGEGGKKKKKRRRKKK